MDRNTITGLLVIGAILFGFTWYNSKQSAKFNEEKARTDSIALAEGRYLAEPHGDEYNPEIPAAVPEINAGIPGQEVADSIRERHFGSMLFAAQRADESFYTIENDLAEYTFSTRGGKITGVRLKDYDRYGGGPVELIADKRNTFDLSFFIKQAYNDIQINTEDYNFTFQPSSIRTNEGAQEISMKLYIDSTSYLEYLYTILPDDYMLGFTMNFVGMRDVMSNQSDIIFTWENSGPQQEKGYENENKYSTVFYKYPGSGDVDNLGISTSSKNKEINSRLHWIAFKQQFFSSIFIAKNDFLNASINYDTYIEGTGNIKKYGASMAVPYSKQTESYDFNFYYGPNKFSTLKKYDIEIQRLVPLGWSIVRWVNRWLVIPVFDFLGKYIGNFGIIILILTIFIKLLILPFTYKSYLSMAKMRLLRPEMDVISEKYPKKEDAMKKQQATMELYKKAGVSPMGGCLPLLFQFPFLIALFYFFPSAIELRGESFLWAEDLSSYDSILNLPFKIPFYGDHISLFALLMALALHFSSRINLSQQAAAPQMAGMQFMTLWLMPVMLLLWFNNYASGLCYYYLLSNLLTMGQTYGMRYIVNDDKLHARMKANAKKPVKQSKWQQRYADMMKAQQQQQKGQQPKKKK